MPPSNALYVRTDERTNAEHCSPTMDQETFVTRGRAYGISPPDLTPLIALIDAATGGTGRQTSWATAADILATIPPDPDGPRHFAELAGDLCAYPDCLTVARDNGWCHKHYPDDVAIERATHGERTKLMPHERTEAMHRMAAQGLTPSQISVKAGFNYATTKAVVAP